VPYMPVRQISMEEERSRLQAHLAAVEERLRDDTEQSLAIALRALGAGRLAYGPPNEPVAPAPVEIIDQPPFAFATPPEPRL
jgi:hypothetical protein